MSGLPAIAVTMGDAAGVGPEIIIRALAQPELYALCRPVVIGDAGHLRRLAHTLHSSLHIHSITAFEEACPDENNLYCLDLGLIPSDLPMGQMSAVAGECAYRAVVSAVELAAAGKVAALCTAPLSKAGLHLAGHRYPGHTELLAALTQTPEVSLMMTTKDLRVIHVTMHVGLLDAVAMIEPGVVYRTIRRGIDAMLAYGIARPRVAVAALNPHAGEGGLFGGGEEEEKILPALRRAQVEGLDVSGPHPGDTVFWRARRGDFDLVVAMYHDQGLGPIKVLGLDDAVNITVGLPVIRTSVGHGTAYDIAGQGKAGARGMSEALKQAALFARGRQP